MSLARQKEVLQSSKTREWQTQSVRTHALPVSMPSGDPGVLALLLSVESVTLPQPGMHGTIIPISATHWRVANRNTSNGQDQRQLLIKATKHTH
jgi:hypothetical protein